MTAASAFDFAASEDVVRLPRRVGEAAYFDLGPSPEGLPVTYDLRATEQVSPPALAGLEAALRHGPVRLLLARGSELERALRTWFGRALRRWEGEEWDLSR